MSSIDEKNCTLIIVPMIVPMIGIANGIRKSLKLIGKISAQNLDIKIKLI